MALVTGVATDVMTFTEVPRHVTWWIMSLHLLQLAVTWMKCEGLHAKLLLYVIVTDRYLRSYDPGYLSKKVDVTLIPESFKGLDF